MLKLRRKRRLSYNICEWLRFSWLRNPEKKNHIRTLIPIIKIIIIKKYRKKNYQNYRVDKKQGDEIIEITYPP